MNQWQKLCCLCSVLLFAAGCSSGPKKKPDTDSNVINKLLIRACLNRVSLSICATGLESFSIVEGGVLNGWPLRKSSLKFSC